MRGTAAAAFLVLVLWGLGCASALHEPSRVERIGTPQAGAPEESAPALLHEASAAWARRPDVDQVRRARTLYLAAARKDTNDEMGVLGAAATTAWLVEHLGDPAERKRLAGEGIDLGQLCLKRAPGDPRCRYRLALALGQQARERPSTGFDGVRRMVELLRGLTKDAPALDAAGPERVLALVLLRAPGWPTGPGDPEEGLAQAQRAVELAPRDPRNHTVLAEALLADGRKQAAREELKVALELARQAAAAGDPDAPGQLEEIDRLTLRCRGSS